MGPTTLPYLPFSKFVAAVDAIPSDAPAKIDASCWSRISTLNGKGRVLLGTFRFLKLISPEGDRLPVFDSILNYKTRPAGMGLVLRGAYPFLNPDNLRSLTLAQLKEIFRKVTLSNAMAQKALSFYLKAAVMANFKLNDQIAPRQHNRSGSTQGAGRDGAKPLVLAERDLEGGGVLEFRLKGQAYARLAPDELQLVHDVGQMLKNVIRRTPGSAESHSRQTTKRIAGAGGTE